MNDLAASPMGEPGNERKTLIDHTRLRWIESWALGWRTALTARYGDKSYYGQLPLDVAVAMIEELSSALRSSEWALDLLAADLMESGQEIGEIIEQRRFERSANAAEARERG